MSFTFRISLYGMSSVFRTLLKISLFLSLVGFCACSKDAAAPTPAQLLVGHWQLVSETNGSTGRTTPANPAQSQEISFTAAGQMTTRVNGTVIKDGLYSLAQQQSTLTNQLETYLITAPGQMQVPITIQVDATTLTLAIDAFDGPSTHF